MPTSLPPIRPTLLLPRRLLGLGFGLGLGLLGACSTTQPAGPRPAEAGEGADLGTDCSGLTGYYRSTGAVAQGGVKLAWRPGFRDVLRGCDTAHGCAPPPADSRLGPPASAEVFGSAAGGLRIDLRDAQGRRLESAAFTPAQLECKPGELQVRLFHGMGDYGRGAWAIGRQTVTLSLSRGAEGRLVVRREERRRDLMPFVVPVFHDEASWYVFDSLPAPAGPR